MASSNSVPQTRKQNTFKEIVSRTVFVIHPFVELHCHFACQPSSAAFARLGILAVN
jgi:hypothetical protein